MNNKYSLDDDKGINARFDIDAGQCTFSPKRLLEDPEVSRFWRAFYDAHVTIIAK